MRLTTVILIASLMQVSASTFGQRITISQKNASLKTVLRELTKQSGYGFFYDGKAIGDSQKVTVSLSNAEFDEAMKSVLTGLNLSYEIDGKIVSIRKIERTPFLNQISETIDVSGRVVDEAGMAIPGATIKVKGEDYAVVSDGEGKFRLGNLRNNAILVVSYLGYVSQEVKAISDRIMTITLIGTSSGLNEVVVVGYGTKQKATLTGAVTTVSSEQLTGRPTTNAATSLQGVTPGLNITRGTGAGRIGQESNNIGMQVRGVTSRSGNEVLVVIDGIIQQSGDINGIATVSALSNINPEDIESITLLKDAQAAIYGSRASGGVLVVTTKKAKTNKPQINLNTTISLNTPGIMVERSNIVDAIKALNQAYVNDGVTNNPWTGPYNYIMNNPIDLSKTIAIPGPFPDTKHLTIGNEDYMKTVWGNAYQQNHTLSISGLSDKSNYYVSAGYVNQNSMLQYGENNNKKYNILLKYNYDINKYLNLKTNVNLVSRKLIEPSWYDDIQNDASLGFRGVPVYNPFGNYYGFGGYLNPAAMAEEGGSSELRNTNVRTSFDLVLTPVKNFTLTAQLALNRDMADNFSQKLGVKTYDWDNGVVIDAIDYNGGREGVYASYSRTSQTLANLLAKYNYDIQKHHFDIMLGASQEQSDYRAFAGTRLGNPTLLNRNIFALTAGDATQQFNNESRNQTALQSLFSTFSYDFNKKYILEANFRYDGTSKFAPGHKFASFGGVSAGWVLSNEPFAQFMKEYLSYAKIRISYGSLGNQTGGAIAPYDYIPLLSQSSQYPFGLPTAPTRAITVSVPTMASPDREWERIISRNIGLDFGFFDNKLTGSFDYFTKQNKNFLYKKLFPAVLGITAPSVNGAKLVTTGWELTAQWNGKIGTDFKYNLGGNLANNTPKVNELPDRRIVSQGFNDYVQGFPVGSYFGYQFDGLISDQQQLTSYLSIHAGAPTNIRTGDAMFKDLNGDGKLTPGLYDSQNPGQGGDIVYLGNNVQKFLYGINLGASYKGIFFSAILQGVGKWTVADNNSPAAPFYVNPLTYNTLPGASWTPDNLNALYPRSTQTDGIIGYNYQMSNAPYFLKSGAYMRLKNVQIGYNLPSRLVKKIGCGAIKVYANGSDLAEWTAMPPGFDPEQPYNFYRTPYPRTYTLGLNLSL